MRRPFLLTIITLITLIAVLHIPVQADRYNQVFIPNPNEQTILSMARLGLPLDNARPVKGEGLEIPLHESEIDLLRANGIPYRIVQEDLEKYYSDICRENLLHIPPQTDTDPVHMKYGSSGGYYTFEEIVADLDSMHLLYPDICTAKEILAYGWDGNPVYLVKVSDNPNIDENEPEALFDATHHAREVGGYTSVLYAMWWLLENYGIDPEATYLVDNRELYFVPVVNPDGLLYNELTSPGGGGLWRKNRRDNGGGIYGVDNARNYTYQWDYDNIGSSPNPGALAYRGPYAGSEPETQAMMTLIESRDIHSSQTFHTYGGWYLSAYCYADIPPEAYDVHQEYMRVMAKDNNYEFGYAGQVFYFANGTGMDYQLHDHEIICFSPETGWNGFYSPIAYIIPEAAGNLRACLHTAWTAGGFVEMTDFAVADGNLTPGQTEELVVTVQNKGWGTSEPVSFQISTSDPYVSVVPVTVQVDSLERRSFFDNSADPITATVSPNCPIGHKAYFTFTLDQGGFIRTQSCSLYVGEPTLLFADGAETGLSNWVINSTWGLDGSNPHTGTYSFSDSPGGNYPNNSSALMTLAYSLDLSSYTSAWLEYWTRWEIQCLEDFGQLEISTNGGISWAPIAALYTTPGSGQGVQPDNQPGYDGASPIWLCEVFDLDPYLGQSNVLFRFEFKSNNSVTLDGWYLDDIKVMGFPEGPSFPDVDITMTPINPPIVIPAAGGSFDFNIALVNNEPTSTVFDTWIMVQLPNGSWYGPVVGPVNLTLISNQSINRDRSQTVPAGAPAGTYLYEGRVGVYPDTIWTEDQFEFEKLGTSDGSVAIGDWMNGGEEFDQITGSGESDLPSEFSLLGNYPNPFNPTTTISYQLSEVSFVNLAVYDISGRMVSEVVNGWRDAGVHEVSFDATGLTSGVCIYKLTAGDYTATQKMVLMK